MITYSAPYARMRALKGNFLSKDQMESLLQTSDLQSIVSILNQTDYNEQIQNLTTPTQIEHGLKQNLILSYIKILNFMRGKSASFLINSLGRVVLFNLN
jgi:vacuolar-type H+-ATPase subunit C/Vma6